MWQGELINMEKFKKGQEVVIKHQQELGVFTVECGFDMLSEPFTLFGNIVIGYVRIGNKDSKGLGYHEKNLADLNQFLNGEVEDD